MTFVVENKVHTHQALTWVYCVFCIVGVAFFGNCFKTISDTNEFGEWNASDYIVLCYISSLTGNVLLGYLYIDMAGTRKHVDLFSTNSKGTASTTPSGSGSGSAPANTPTTTTTQSGTVNTTLSTSSPKTTTSSSATKSTSIAIISTSGNTTSTSAVNGASGSKSNIPNIEEIRERNRLLQEQILLEHQLNETRNQQVTGPNDSVLFNNCLGEIDAFPLYDREARNIQPTPSYDDATYCQESKT